MAPRTLAPRTSKAPRRSLSTAIAAGLLGLGLLALPALPLTGHAGLAHAQFAPGTGRAPASFADIVDRVKPAVVSIYVSGGGPRSVAQAPGQKGPQGPQQGQPRQGPRLPDSIPEEYRKFFEEFFGRGGPGGQGGPGGGGSPLPSLAQGSGFLISEDGYIVTNNHVVENGDKIQITFDGQEKLDAEKIGTDPRTDIALLKIKSPNKRFPFVKFANKDPRVGDWVLAVGNPFGFGGTVTAGIVSALARDVGGALNDFLQIDAAVNRGNSGGPTFNLEGEVVGVNTAIYSPSGGNVGIAFAVPAKTVMDVVAQLRQSGSVSRGWLGVKIENIDDDKAQAMGMTEAKGALVSEATRNAPAFASGIKDGDVIISVNGEKINDSRDLARKVAGLAPGATADIRVLRAGREQSIPVKLGDFKDASGQPAQPKADPSRPAAPAASTEIPSLGLSLAAPGSTAAKNVRDGVLISEVKAGTDASGKGLRGGDIILEVNGNAVSAAADVLKAIEDADKAGRKAVLLRVKSGDTARFVGVQIKK
jgi:serine protease Do